MLEDTARVKVVNISNSTVGYVIPELQNLTRRFSKGEGKDLLVSEIRALSYVPGGMKLLKDYLSIRNEDLLAELGIPFEPEYNWTKADVENMLVNDTLPRLQDALEFAPAGIVDMIKDLAVSLPLNDMSKRQAILEATGFNVTSAIRIVEESKEVDTPAEKPASSGRRVTEDAPAADASTSGRRVTTEYKVVS